MDSSEQCKRKADPQHILLRIRSCTSTVKTGSIKQSIFIKAVFIVLISADFIKKY